MGQKWTPKRVRTRKGLNRLNAIKRNSFSMILGFGAVSFRNKNIKESLKKPIRRGHTVLHRLFVDFGSILAPFWEPNRQKHRSKKPSKKRTSKKRRPRGSGTPSGFSGRIGTIDFGRRGGGRGRGKPLPQGILGKEGLEGRWAALNHRSPMAGGIIPAKHTHSERIEIYSGGF